MSMNEVAGPEEGRNLYRPSALLYPIVYAIAVALFAAIAGKREYFAMAWICLLPVLPIFLVANDFGRWFSMAYISLLFVAASRGLARPVPFVAPLAILLSSVVTYDNVGGVYLSGVANRIADGLSAPAP